MLFIVEVIIFFAMIGFNTFKGKKEKIIVAVSGGFDPLHIGHVRMMQEAKALGDKLVVILNNDNWLKKKKGFVFMSQKERKELIEALGCVDKVIITRHGRDDEDRSVCEDLIRLRPHVFVNGGDRTRKNIPEAKVCKDLGCKMIFNIGRGGKVQSSSWLVEKYQKSRDREAIPGGKNNQLCLCGSGRQFEKCHGK